jgi:NADH-quinone oxidoreductase subunit M
MVIAAIGTVLAAGYLLWMLQRVTFGKVNPEFENAHIHDVHVPEWVAWTPLLVLILVLDIFPDILFSVTDPAVSPIGKVFSG